MSLLVTESLDEAPGSLSRKTHFKDVMSLSMHPG